jgi:apolipoprotein N-acyltransferase
MTLSHLRSPALRPVLFAIASGTLFALSLPPYNVEWLGWFTFAPVLVAAARLPRALWAAGAGFLSGIACGVVQIGWRGSGSALNYAWTPFIWIALILAVVCAFASWQRRQWTAGGLPWVLSVARMGVAAEWLTVFTPLPVGVALCQHRNGSLIQIASFTGIWGVSFLLSFVNAALADAALRRKLATLPLAVALTLLSACWAGGAFLEKRAGFMAAEVGTPRLRVAAIQDYSGIEAPAADPDAPVPTGDQPESAVLMRQAAEQGAQLIVGTENAFGYTFVPNDPRSEMNRLAKETGRWLVVGQEMNGDPKPFNCASLVSSNGETVGTHHKIALFLGERQNMQPGDHASAWATPYGKVGLLICFDSCYPAVTRQAVRAGAQIIAMPNYDPPTPHAVLHHLHAALTPFRAVENRVAFIRADPNGRSQIINPWGHIIAETPLYRAQSLVAEVLLGDGAGTLFTRFGDWFAYGCVLIVVAMTWIALAPAKRVAHAGARSRPTTRR